MHIHDDAAAPQQFLFAKERHILADDHARNAIEQDRARTHGARRERGVENALRINRRGPSAGVLEGIHFAVQNGAAALHPAVVTASDDLALMHKDRTDRDTAFGLARFRLYWQALKKHEDGAKAFERIFMADMIAAQGGREQAIDTWETLLLDYVKTKLH